MDGSGRVMFGDQHHVTNGKFNFQKLQLLLCICSISLLQMYSF
jgi:hypothetical protein